jgi:uncharacterized protein
VARWRKTMAAHFTRARAVLWCSCARGRGSRAPRARVEVDVSKIQTAFGGVWDAKRPEAYDYTLYEIAFALENVCRWAGHPLRFYSVAEHSVRVARLVEDLGGTAEQRRAALIHDAAEAFLGDMPSSIKHMPEMAGYRALYAAAEAAIYTAFELPGYVGDALVKEADAMMLAVEREDLFRLKQEHIPAVVDAWAACPPLPARPRAAFIRATESDQGWSQDFVNEWRRAGGVV